MKGGLEDGSDGLYILIVDSFGEHLLMHVRAAGYD